MKLLVAVLCALVIGSLGIGIYSEIQRRDIEKDVVRLQKIVAAQRKALNSLKSEVGKPDDEYVGGGYSVNPYLKRNPYSTR